MVTNNVAAPTVLKQSYYNFYIKKDDEGYIVYNSATGVIIDVHSPDMIERLKQLMASENITYDEDDEMIRSFAENGLLVPVEINEYTHMRYCYERDIVRDRTLRLTLITTRQCNLRCVYCYEEHEDKAMPPELYEALLRHIEKGLKDKTYSGVSIGLFGGEPFVEYNNVIDFLERAQKICEEHEVFFGAGATTNGALIYPERFERLSKAGCGYYQISIDGFADTHDRYRPNAGGKGSWQQIIDNLLYMKSTDYEFQVTIRTNFNDEVIERAAEFYRYITDTFDSRFTIYYEGIKHLGGQNDEKVQILDGQSVSEKTIDIAQTAMELGLGNDVVDSFTLPYARVCYASKHNDFLIDWDGSILKCTLSLDDDLNHIGKVADDGSFELDSARHSHWVTCKADLSEACRNCKVLPLCFGGRCINGRIHGEPYNCDPSEQEAELAGLIKHFKKS